jgi:hypothetical protein
VARLGKNVVFCLILILATSILLLVKPIDAQSMSKPSVPQFTVTVLENKTVLLSVKNQPFDVNNSYNYSFVYDVRITNFLGNWTDLYNADDGYPVQSNSDYTIFSYIIADSPSYYPTAFTLEGRPIPTNAQVTFQVKAMIGYRDRGPFSNGMMPYVFKGESSDWSNNQTIDIPLTDDLKSIYISPLGKMSTFYRLIVYSPNNQSNYYNTVPLNFTLIWSYDIMPLFELKANYSYRIDDNSYVSIVPTQSPADQNESGTTFVYNPSFAYPLNITNLSDGYHKVLIKASFYFGKNLFLDAASAPFYFYVQKTNPPPTLPNINPTSSPNPNTDIAVTLVLIAIAVIVIFVISFLLYVRHLKRSTTKN